MKLFATIIASPAAGIHSYSSSSSSSTSDYYGECGGTITEFQTITSPGFDRGYYYDNLDCVWDIQLGDIAGFNIIPLHFDVKYDSDCGYDYVKVVDGSGYERNFCGSNPSSRRRRYTDEKKVEGKWHTDLVNVKNDGFESLLIEGGSAVITFSTDHIGKAGGFEFELQKRSRLQIIEAHAQRIFDALADTGYGARYQGRMEKIFRKLSRASAFGEVCYFENGFGSEADGVLVFDDSDMCKLNGQVNAAINSFARRYACDGRGKVYRQIIRAARKVRNFMNEKHNCE